MADARTQLEQAAAGATKRPRGNSVLPEEHAASAPFAKACFGMAESARISMYRNRGHLIEDDEAPAAVLTAPSEAVPPLP